jgi:hypothetical protein
MVRWNETNSRRWACSHKRRVPCTSMKMRVCRWRNHLRSRCHHRRIRPLRMRPCKRWSRNRSARPLDSRCFHTATPRTQTIPVTPNVVGEHWNSDERTAHKHTQRHVPKNLQSHRVSLPVRYDVIVSSKARRLTGIATRVIREPEAQMLGR